MGIPLLSDEIQLRSVAFQIHFTNTWGWGYCDYCPSEATIFIPSILASRYAIIVVFPKFTEVVG